MADTQRVPAMLVGVEGARPYGLAGNLPADAVVAADKPHGRGRPYVSDVPFVQPYNERPTCSGLRTDGERCKGKAQPGGAYCEHHDPER